MRNVRSTNNMIMLNNINLTFLLLLLLNISSIFGLQFNTSKKFETVILIKDFLKTWNQPVKITTSTLCWNRQDFYVLTKILSENGLFVTPSYEVELKTFWPHEQQVFLVDLECRNGRELLKMASQEKLLDHPFRWILLEDPLHPDIPEKLPIFISSKIYIIQKIDNKYKIISKYRLGYSSYEYYTNDIALYCPNNKFEYINKLTDGLNRTNLHGLLFNTSMVILNNDTINHLLDTRDKHIEPFTKVNYPMTIHIYEYLNATQGYIYRKTWGYKYNHSEYFDGMMGDLQNGTAEIGASSTYAVEARLKYMEPVFLSTPTKTLFVFRSPPLSYVQNIYTLPFNSHVWLSCLVLTIIVPIFFYIVTYWEFIDAGDSFHEREKSNNSVARLRPHFFDILQLQIGAICQQGSESEPISSAGRITTFVLFVTMFFLYTSYSANIVALLQSTSDSINTLDDLLNTRIELGAEDIPYNRYFLMTASGKVQQELYNSKLAPPGKEDNFMSLEEGVKKIRNEYFAFHAEMTTVYKCVSDTFLESEKCGLKEIDFFTMFPPYYLIRKNSTYRELFRLVLRKMGERGIKHCLYSRIYLKQPICQTQGGNFLSVSLMDCYAPVLIFGIGVVIACFVFVLEMIIQPRIIHTKFNSDARTEFNGKWKRNNP